MIFYKIFSQRLRERAVTKTLKIIRKKRKRVSTLFITVKIYSKYIGSSQPYEELLKNLHGFQHFILKYKVETTKRILIFKSLLLQVLTYESYATCN